MNKSRPSILNIIEGLLQDIPDESLITQWNESLNRWSDIAFFDPSALVEETFREKIEDEIRRRQYVWTVTDDAAIDTHYVRNKGYDDEKPDEYKGGVGVSSDSLVDAFDEYLKKTDQLFF